MYIGSTRYATLSDAVEAVPEDSTQTTITLYSDITSASKVNVLDCQNIVFDMNDCAITSSIVSGYAINIQSGGQLKIKDGTIVVESAGGICVQDGGIGNITNMNIDVSKNAIYNMGTITEISDNNISADTAIYNVSVIEKIASGVYTGTKRGIYNDGSILSLCGGSFKGSNIENSVYTTDETQLVRNDGSINYVDLETGKGYITVVPEADESIELSTYVINDLTDIFDDTSYTYKGIPSNVTDYSQMSGYYGTGSVISLFDAETGEYVKSVNVVIPGDVNGDSACDVLDAFWVVRTSSGFNELNGVYFDAANFDYDDEISVTDYSAIVNLVLQ